MRAQCWLVGHKRESRSRFIRRLDGYPLGIYRLCERCGKRLDLTYGRDQNPPPFDVAMAAKWAREFGD